MGFLFAVLIALIGLQNPRPTGTAAIEGVVTRMGTSRPIENATVVIRSEKLHVEAKSDRNGQFVVSSLPAGSFTTHVHAEGYLDYPGNMVDRFDLSDGERLRRDVVLSAVSSISGRILDDNREPLTGITVEILQQSRDVTGKLRWRNVSSAITDEKGGYRFEPLGSGDFYVRASRKPLGSVSDQDPAEMTTTFFPGTLDVRAAAAISLRDGDEKTAEFSLAKGRTFTIAGTIENGRESRIPVMLFVVPQDAGIPLDEFFASGISVNEKFELKGLLPGAYDLFAVRFSSNQTGLDGAPEKIAARAAKGFAQIRNEDVRDLRLTLETGGDVSGRIRFVGKSVPLPGLQLTLARRDVVARMAQAGVLNSPESFQFSGTVPGIYDVSIQIPQRDAYVADVRALGRSIVDDGLTVGRDPIDSLEVWIDVDGGAVKGTIASTKKAPVLVVLASHASRRQSSSVFDAIRLDDPSKPFAFSAVPPGLYSLFAFELTSSDEVLPVLSQDFLSLYQSKSMSISVENGATVTPAPLSLIAR